MSTLACALSSKAFAMFLPPDVYVAHASSRSFKTSREPLIARNRPILDARFPGFPTAVSPPWRLTPKSPYVMHCPST